MQTLLIGSERQIYSSVDFTARAFLQIVATEHDQFNNNGNVCPQRNRARIFVSLKLSGSVVYCPCFMVHWCCIW